MYNWILTELVEKDMGESEKLSGNEVMIISSDKERAYFLGQYRDNLKIQMRKKLSILRGCKTLHPKYDNGRGDNSSLTFTLFHLCIFFSNSL